MCVTDSGEGASDVKGIVTRADALAASLEDVLVALAPDIAAIALASGVDER